MCVNFIFAKLQFAIVWLSISVYCASKKYG